MKNSYSKISRCRLRGDGKSLYRAVVMLFAVAMVRYGGLRPAGFAVFSRTKPLMEPMTERFLTPDKEQIALLDVFDRLGMGDIQLVSTPAQAMQALQDLAGAAALGFDTESKPTFAKNELSTGPHIVQLSTLDKSWIFQLEDAECRRVVGTLLESSGIVKAGFGLGDDRKRIVYKLGVDLQGVLDLNNVFKEKGYRKDMGVRGAVAVIFNKRFIKSKKAATSNWANPQLTEAQLVYAANDAYAAMRVYAALGL